jgi:hypothetical protein
MQVLMTRTRHGFVPADEQAQDECAKVKIGTTMLMDLKRARNPRQHALMFAALNTLFENQRDPVAYKTFDQFYVAVKYALGWYDQVPVKAGKETIPILWSLSFANMPQEKFEPCLEQLLDLYVRLLGVTKDEARSAVEARATGLPAYARQDLAG